MTSPHEGVAAIAPLDEFPQSEPGRVLVYRLGSMGDFVVALPCLHLIRSRFPATEIGLLTNHPVESRAAQAASILEGTDLIDRYLIYPAGDYQLSAILRVAGDIRSFRADLLVYLVERTAAWQVYRDYIFFRSCGLRRIVGLPFTSNLRNCRSVPGTRVWESEAQRLARCIAPLGHADCDRLEGWNLRLSETEIAAADEVLSEEARDTSPGLRLLGMSIGTKQAINDWGDSNWHAVLTGLGPSLPNFALALIGAAEDQGRSLRLATSWPGPVFNFCGRVPPRLSAALLRRVEVLLCHDSGPMHLAAAVGTRCIAVFSNKDPPGKWFPFGNGHTVIRPTSPTDTIQDIAPDAVIAAVYRSLKMDGAPAQSDCADAATGREPLTQARVSS